MISLLTIIGFFFGASLASFWGQIWSRKHLHFRSTRSSCDHCQKPLSPFALIPVLGYLWQGGTSSCCHKSIPLAYPVSEIGNGLLAALLVWGILKSEFIGQRELIYQLFIILTTLIITQGLGLLTIHQRFKQK